MTDQHGRQLASIRTAAWKGVAWKGVAWKGVAWTMIRAAIGALSFACNEDSNQRQEALDAASSWTREESGGSSALDAQLPSSDSPDAGDEHAVDAAQGDAVDAAQDAAMGFPDARVLDDAEVELTEASVVPKTCTPPGVAFEQGMVSYGEHGYHLTVSSDPAPPEVGYNTWRVQLTDESSQAAWVSQLILKPFMPTHGHGAKFEPTITELGQGEYEIRVHFSMPGYWRMTFEFDVATSLPDAAAPGTEVSRVAQSSASSDAGSSRSNDAGLSEAGASQTNQGVSSLPDEGADSLGVEPLHETVVLHLCI